MAIAAYSAPTETSYALPSSKKPVGSDSLRNVWGVVLTVTGSIACPCHLPFTLPILIGVLGGTGIGAGIAANVNLIYVIATGYFVIGIAVGLYLLNRRQRGTRVTKTQMQVRDEEFTET